MPEETGKRIGDYEILGVLGAGGMGQVFKVRNVISDRVEAMKILLPDLAGRQDLADRFLREIKVLAALDHPNIAALRTALTLGNQLVMVMEFVEGTSLATRLERGPVAPAEALNYIDQVLSALSYAHARQVIHRDIKPANMMLTPDGVVKLMDFGIARTGTDRTLTATGTTMGSMYYMSPEQVKGGTTDARSDLYSLGVTLYEIVTGQRPFKADSDYSLMAAQVQQQPRPPIELRADMPAALNEIILLAMAKEPAQRFQSADAFRKALGTVRAQLEKSGAVVAATQTATSTPVTTALFQGQTAPANPIHDLPTASAPVPMQPELAPQPVPGVLELSAQRPTHRGLYMTLGALVVLAVLVVAGIYVPRRSKTRADEAAQQAANQSAASTSAPSSSTNGANGAQTADSTAPQNSTAAPSASAQDSTSGPNSNPPADAAASASPGDSSANAVATQPPNPPADETAKAGGKQPRKPTSKNGGGSMSPAGSASQDNASAAANAAAQSNQAAQEQMEQVEKEVDQLSSRTGAVNDSLDNMRREQSAQGFGLRGDIASTQESLKIHMSKAQQALQNQDVKSAKRYLDLAEPEIEKLEKFLGR
ncbi:MAG: serine/threonine-protein kinase [Terriglobales bacterium]